MRRRAVKGLSRLAMLAAGFAVGAGIVEDAALPGLLRAAGMLSLAVALLSVLGREGRRLGRTCDDIRARALGPPLRHLLLGKRRQLDEALHR
jgi:hypothetical protein